jgi:hypothetical protein
MLTEVIFVRHPRSVSTLEGETQIVSTILLAGVFMRRDRSFTPTVLTYGGTTQPWVIGETPTGAIDGTNTTYHTANNYMNGFLGVYLNGLRLKNAYDFTETGVNVFVMSYAPSVGDLLTVDYIKA